MRLIYIATVCLLLIGCQSLNNETANERENNENEIIHVKDTSPNEEKQQTNQEIATHLSNIASQVHDVNDAASVVVGPYAVVGIDIDENLERQRVGTVKYSVTEALREDPYGKTAVVIADGDLLERFRQMGKEIQQGHPIKGIVEELAEIINRYMPTIPIEDEFDDGNKPNHLKDNEDDEKLKEIQEEQSEEN